VDASSLGQATSACKQIYAELPPLQLGMDLHLNAGRPTNVYPGEKNVNQ
jgi:hypothetical protein